MSEKAIINSVHNRDYNNQTELTPIDEHDLPSLMTTNMLSPLFEDTQTTIDCYIFLPVNIVGISPFNFKILPREEKDH